MFFTDKKLFVLFYSNRPQFKRNKHSLRSDVANQWARPTQPNTLNKIEDRESFVDAENGMYIFVYSLNVTKVSYVLLWKVFLTFPEQFENMTLNRTTRKPVGNNMLKY